MISDNNQTTQLPQTAVKCRFFAQYYDLEIAKHNTKKYFVKHILDKVGDYYFIELKNINKITKDDIVFCVNLMGKAINLEEAEDFKDSFIEAFLNKEFYGTFYPYRVCEIIDYLRSKGYAIPFMEYSVEDLVSFGWVRLV